MNDTTIIIIFIFILQQLEIKGILYENRNY